MPDENNAFARHDIWTDHGNRDRFAITLSEPIFNKRRLRFPCGHVDFAWWRYFVRSIGNVFECCKCHATWEYNQ